MTGRGSTAGTSLLIIAKSPVPGRVKTRLCPPCTPNEAAAVAEAALADTFRAVSATPVARRVLVLDGEPGPWVPEGYEVVEQSAGGLDERLAAAFSSIRGPALLIGMDTPQVSSALLSSSIDRLCRRGMEAVLGAASDGGWWGIGLRRADPRVFLGVPMSTSLTGAAQANRLDMLGLRWLPLPWLRDVDSFEDALAVARTIPRSRFADAVAAVAGNLLKRAMDPSPAWDSRSEVLV
jgi:uncharacterized protein